MGTGGETESLNVKNEHYRSEEAPVTEKSDSVENKIFIGGLSWQTTIDGLRFYFEKFGELSDVALMTDKHTGQPRGFGFVTMTDTAGKLANISITSGTCILVTELAIASVIGYGRELVRFS